MARFPEAEKRLLIKMICMNLLPRSLRTFEKRDIGSQLDAVDDWLGDCHLNALVPR